MADKKYRLKFGMSDGTEQSVEFTAPQGDKGDPGITPVVAVNDISGGHRVTITTGSNVQSFDVMDGKNAEGGGTADAVAWENVTGKPFNESLTGTAIADGDTLHWDGDKDAMPIMIGNAYTKFCYVSDNVPTMEQISAGHTIVLKTYTGTEVNINVTPSEHDGYITFSDVDGQYLHIIKKPCTIGINTFERAGIYFYAQGDSTAHICRLTINGYTFTAMDSIKDAYIPQTIARKSDIPQGGGAQVQSDYTQHDATQPDYIKNRPFWPKWSPVLLCEYMSGTSGNRDDVYLVGSIADKVYATPVEGKRYVFGVSGGNVYSGTAVLGSFQLGSNNLYGVGIVAEENSEACAVRIDIPGMTAWCIKIPDRRPNGGNYSGVDPFFVIEGGSAYNKLRVPDDVIKEFAITAGVNAVYDLTKLIKSAESGDTEAAKMFNALKSDVEITIDMDGVETTLTSNDLVYAPGQDMMGVLCDLYLYGSTPLAAIVYARLGSTDIYILALMDVKTLYGAGPTAKSIKVNYPGIFAQITPAKKIPAECLPGMLIAYTNSVSTDTSTPGVYKEPMCENDYKYDYLCEAIQRGRQIYICIVDDAGNPGSYYAVLRVEKKYEDGFDKIYLWYLYDDMTLRRCMALSSYKG